MKKTYLFHILFLAMIAVVGFSSCDEESIEPTLLNEELVGESIIRLTYQDTLVIRKNVVATVDEKGLFTFDVKGKGKDMLSITTFKFEEGLFPSNINVAKYLFADLSDVGLSVDHVNPLTNTGWIRISSINKVGGSVDGEFKIKIYPPILLDPSDPNFDLQTGIINLPKAFEIQGEFRNLRYQRAEGDYFETKIDGAAWAYKTRKVSVVGNRVVITTSNSVTEEVMELSFDKNVEEGNYGLENFQAKYKSANGVNYSTYLELGGSTLQIKENKNNRVKGSFNLKMKNEAGTQTLNFTEGSFSLAY
ncbi:DUF6252 family protein [Flavobacterium sp. JP2137]|uniref:DUF6252 family protein n=1 Tax=Flavobacterium sp. JP2137 TaxID=3414510 RepID=UPI003D2FAA74